MGVAAHGLAKQYVVVTWARDTVALAPSANSSTAERLGELLRTLICAHRTSLAVVTQIEAEIRGLSLL